MKSSSYCWVLFKCALKRAWHKSRHSSFFTVRFWRELITVFVQLSGFIHQEWFIRIPISALACSHILSFAAVGSTYTNISLNVRRISTNQEGVSKSDFSIFFLSSSLSNSLALRANKHLHGVCENRSRNNRKHIRLATGAFPFC